MDLKSIKTQWGIPILTADAVYEYLEQVGIRSWPELEPPADLATYIASPLTDEQRTELRYAPKAEVVTHRDPKGNPFRGFRTVMKNWATTFCLLPGDYVVLVAEWKHGANVISLVPPSGVPSKKDNGSMETCAKREFEEETGMGLEHVELLSGPNGLPIATRGLTTSYFPFLGRTFEDIHVGPSSLDEKETLQLLLMPLTEWLQLIETGRVYEECAVSITFLALNRLGRLRLS
ncbi:MAG: NUDIX domain-containing protein [Patescibacteria group bacterium]